MDEQSLLYKLGLALVSGVGTSLAQNLISHVGSVDDIFREKAATLQKIPGIGPNITNNILKAENLKRAEEEIRFIQRNKINYSFFLDNNYPVRLKQCQDSPIILFFKGRLNSFPKRALSVIGTRNPSTRGRKITRDWIREISEKDPAIIIVSGLAYGIDIQAHEASLDFGMETYAGLGHGFHTIYPAIHRSTARRITTQGALITDFFSYSKLEPKNFIRRNRLIAGLSDATLVIESKEKGGAMVTADMANSYNRDVLAVPGRPDDLMSIGCNNLIKSNRAALVQTVEDIFFFLGWDEHLNQSEKINNPDTIELNEKENVILSQIGIKPISKDQLSIITKMNIPEVSFCLLTLEFKGLITAKPGNSYIRKIL